MVETLPIKTKKVKIKSRYFNYIVVKWHHQTYIKRRLAGDIWEGLYEFPLIETDIEIDEKSILDSKEFNSILSNSNYEITSVSSQVKHQLTHQTIFCKFFNVEMEKMTNIKGFESVSWSDLENYPKPTLIQRFYLNN